jgi:hypothetical protein
VHSSRTSPTSFADLVRELRDQGVGNKVIADMFGMALRTYRRKVARMSESRTEHGRSLWEAVLRYVQQEGPVSRGEVLQRFARDDDEVLRSVLLDLIETGLLLRTGTEDTAILEATRPEDAVNDAGTLESLVLVALHSSGPLAVAQIAQVVPAVARSTSSSEATRSKGRLAVPRSEHRPSCA